MAAYILHLGEPRGEVLLNKRHWRKSGDATVPLDSSLVYTIGLSHDPYRTRTWTGTSLIDWQREVDTLLKKRKGEILAEIKKKVHENDVKDLDEAAHSSHRVERRTVQSFEQYTNPYQSSH